MVIQEHSQNASATLQATSLSHQAFSTTEILSSVEVGQLGQKFSSEMVSIAEIAAAGTLTEEKRKEITKNLIEKHTLECAQLENELRSNEIKMITDVISEYEQKKEKALADLQVCRTNHLFVFSFCFVCLFVCLADFSLPQALCIFSQSIYLSIFICLSVCVCVCVIITVVNLVSDVSVAAAVAVAVTVATVNVIFNF